jgi:TonB family protein
LPNGARGPASNGHGSGGGIGDFGDGGGVGNRKGPGAGPDDGPLYGLDYTGLKGARITQPELLRKTEPEYSEEARKAKVQGTVVLEIQVGTDGRAHNIVVHQGVGLGLDQKAIDAVSHWLFRPGTVNGRAAVITAIVQVNFRLL